MPLLTKQAIRSSEPSTLTFTQLDGSSDAIAYTGGDEVLVLENTSGSEVTVTLLGNQATSVTRSGITRIDVSGGKSIALPANSYTKIFLRDASAYLTDSDNQPAINGASASINAAHLIL